jgi:hypothetical protein
MSLSQMQVFNSYLMPVLAEIYPQEIQKFNAASNGAIVLQSAGFDGDFFRESFYNALHSAQRRVDRYAAQASAAATDLTQSQQSMVKVAGGFGPIRYEPSQMSWLNKPTQEGIEVAARMFAEALLADQLNTAVAAGVAAIGNVAALVNDVSASAKITHSALNSTDALFGDMSQRLVARIMTGLQYHTLIGENITNATDLFKSDTVRIVDILGKAIVVTDVPALRVTGTPNKQKVLTLVAGGIMVSDSGDLITNIETKNGQTRIETTMQSDYTFGLGIKGFTWDETNGGKSPTDAELATGTNWDKVKTSVKECAGVLTVGQE